MRLIVFTFALIQLSLANTVVQQQRAKDICYTGYGCFTTAAPFWDLFVRPLVLLPEAPEKVATKFLLYTRNNPTTPTQINSGNPSANFGASRKTRFIVHGFLHNGYKQWVIDMKDALLKVEDCNVVAVDWSKGNGFPYTQATANTQIVGADIAILVNSYIEKGLITADDVHIIGHSLGSHIAGYAGQRIPNLGRITGLDPAGPYFENADPVVRLDPTDAKFVEAIHTDGAASIQLGLGLMQRLGHVDFYPNGGKDQPKCPKTSMKLLGAIFNLVTVDVDGIEDAVACSHMTAVHFYTDSILRNDCTYTAYPCSKLDDFKSGKCITCSAKGCNHMGHWASPSNDLGMLFFTTQDATALPYCYNHYKVKAVSNSLAGQGKTKGVFSVVLRGSKKSSLQFLIDNADTTLTTGSVLESLAESTSEIGDIQGATVSFTKASCLLFCFGLDDKWSFSSLEIVDGQSQTVAKLCPSKSFISSGSSVDFTLC